MRPSYAVCMVWLALTTGCSSTSGRTQSILIATEPAGADCRLFRSGVEIGGVPLTPGTVEVRKSAVDLVVVCDKEGYQRASIVNKADVAATTVLGSILFGATGWAVDNTTGTSDRYDGAVKLTLRPVATAE